MKTASKGDMLEKEDQNTYKNYNKMAKDSIQVFFMLINWLTNWILSLERIPKRRTEAIG